MTAPAAQNGPDAVRLETADAARDFTLHDQTGAAVTLSGLRGHKVILYFYPEADTPGCTTEACDFRDNLASLQGAGYRVYGVSRDDLPKLQKFAAGHELGFPLLSDPDRSVHEAYGAWGEKSLYGKKITGVIRSTFVIDENGTIVWALYNVKATGHVASLRKKLGLAA
ncbi:MAG TPA: thioredoxin-dependent thiol peroxidase [Pseudolysinimonas sp.]|nr:thioredoxin-dependent thiol peroxidase [Pseudolysinimonas sp.]